MKRLLLLAKTQHMKIFLIFITTIFPACASTSGVVPMGGDTFMVSRSEKGFDTTGSRVKADALKEANVFCSSKGKSIVIIKTMHQDMVPFKSDSQAEIEFKCVSGK